MNAERPDSTDREIFEQRLEERKERSLPALLAGRLRIDEILKTELEAPGSDQRGGVTLIARPPAEVIERVSRIQSRLQAVEPSQYYCPAGDLHLTLVEICHGRTLSEARLLAQRVSAAIGDVLAEASRFWLDRPRLGFDDGGAALSFQPVGAALQSTRRSIIERLGKLGVEVQSRYPAQSAHVTLMRYTNRLRSRPADWVRRLQSLSPGPPLRWCAARVELTHGAIWYGMRSRVSVEGPFPLPGRQQEPRDARGESRGSGSASRDPSMERSAYVEMHQPSTDACWR